MPHSSPVITVTSLPKGKALMPKPPLLDRIKIPMTWTWFWRLRGSLSRRKKIDLNSWIINFKLAPENLLPALSLGNSAFITNGLQVWIMGEAEIVALRSQFWKMPGTKVVASPSFSTADGIESRLSMTSPVSIGGKRNDVGLDLDLMPLVERKSTDLTALLSLSEIVTNQSGAISDASLRTDVISIRTNLALAARIKIPFGKSVFLLAKGDDTNAGSFGIIISPILPKKK